MRPLISSRLRNSIEAAGGRRKGSLAPDHADDIVCIDGVGRQRPRNSVLVWRRHRCRCGMARIAWRRGFIAGYRTRPFRNLPRTSMREARQVLIADGLDPALIDRSY